mmetsp:Transcript_43797/g.115770  ORF Transcript_43797/g.115770 Transcript_43797/m.115770 type:complete len:278 (+) Transcript_43797:3925-4758(+)
MEDCECPQWEPWHCPASLRAHLGIHHPSQLQQPQVRSGQLHSIDEASDTQNIGVATQERLTSEAHHCCAVRPHASNNLGRRPSRVPLWERCQIRISEDDIGIGLHITVHSPAEPLGSRHSQRCLVPLHRRCWGEVEQKCRLGSRLVIATDSHLLVLLVFWSTILDHLTPTQAALHYARILQRHLDPLGPCSKRVVKQLTPLVQLGPVPGASCQVRVSRIRGHLPDRLRPGGGGDGGVGHAQEHAVDSGWERRVEQHGRHRVLSRAPFLRSYKLRQSF